MADIRIHRDHALGLTRAREIAWAWAEQVEEKFGMDCTVLEGETSDTVAFTRSGVKGELIVAAKHFELHAKLGLLLGAFKTSIEGEIEKELDGLLAAESSAKPAKVAKAATKVAAPKATAKAAAKKKPT
ncbi:polyhydroxyalkanoic acid system family protein [Paucibacter sp. KCTC 42545]|uniref:polyhydroxyalkanoic acid system family protein n=1 Tax=Paucibacter sp. KCTC 42545 TaxID=1768242 RepID=UPI000733BF22|nr:polyhydroxyalkanoic acid system family protein [Paucibacter sp. KCTC 42545]ALT76070.1 polyhydroxyalkanoic acid synthase [Paucibacter sp. KCTC 42545]